MIKRTNVALGIAAALYFIPHVNNKFLFFPVVIISSLIPDLVSFLDKNGFIRSHKKINIISKFLGSYLICAIVSILFAFFYPVLALPFFVGYSFTLTLNAFSKIGIQPFWPISKKVSQGPISPGGKIDMTLFYAFVIFDAALLVKLIV